MERIQHSRNYLFKDKKMKRSEVVHRISDNVLSSFLPDWTLNSKNLLADVILTEIEKLGFKLTETYGDGFESELHEVPYEPEIGWEAWIIEQDKKDTARDFTVVLTPMQIEGKQEWFRSQLIAQAFLQGRSFEELAKDYNVTRERIRQIVCKERRRYLYPVKEEK